MDVTTLQQQQPPVVVTDPSEWEEAYKPLPYLFCSLFIVWALLVFAWVLNTWTKRRWQTSTLQWVLAAVPTLKTLVHVLSFVFWYSCLNSRTCSFWVAFGVFLTRIFFETAYFVAFLLIAHGYCIMHEQLAIQERRTIAGLASLLYLILTGYKAAVPQFAVLVILMYGILVYVIMALVARNLGVLRGQLQHIQDEGVHVMHTAVYMKYTMFKNFQKAMLIMVVAQIVMHVRAEAVATEYWVQLLLRELTELGIFFYIGWTFRSRERTPFFTVIPTLHASGQCILPPIYSVEMDAKEFNNLDYKEWHIGIPTSISKGMMVGHRPMLVIVQNPGMSNFRFMEDFKDGLPSNSRLTDTSFDTKGDFQPASGVPALPSSAGISIPLSLSIHTPDLSRAENTSLPLQNRNSNSPSIRDDTSAQEGKTSVELHSENCRHVDDVVVNVRTLKGYSFLPLDPNLQGFIPSPLT